MLFLKYKSVYNLRNLIYNLIKVLNRNIGKLLINLILYYANLNFHQQNNFKNI